MIDRQANTLRRINALCGIGCTTPVQRKASRHSHIFTRANPQQGGDAQFISTGAGELRPFGHAFAQGLRPQILLTHSFCLGPATGKRISQGQILARFGRGRRITHGIHQHVNGMLIVAQKRQGQTIIGGRQSRPIGRQNAARLIHFTLRR